MPPFLNGFAASNAAEKQAMIGMFRHKPENLRELLSADCFAVAEAWDLSSARALDARGFPTLYVRTSMMCGAASFGGQVASVESLCAEVQAPVIAEIRALDLVVPTVRAAVVNRMAESGVGGVAIAGDEAQLSLMAGTITACREFVGSQCSSPLIFGVMDRSDVGGLSRAIRDAESLVRAGAEGLILRNGWNIDELASFARILDPTSVMVELHQDEGMRIGDLKRIGVRSVLASGMLALSAIAGDPEAVNRLSDEGSDIRADRP